MSAKKDPFIKTLDSVRCEISQINRQLEGIIHPNISKQLLKIYEMCDTILTPIDEEEEKFRNSNYDVLDQIKKENNIKLSVWSMDIPATDMHKKTPPITKITYESWGATQVHEFDKPTKLTWMEFWKLADKMIETSGDTHHVFIENLHHNPKDPKTHFSLVCGS